LAKNSKKFLDSKYFEIYNWEKYKDRNLLIGYYRFLKAFISFRPCFNCVLGINAPAILCCFSQERKCRA